MSFLADNVFDSGLSYLTTNGSRLDICSQEPTTYGQATTDGAYSLGYKTSLSIGAPADRGGGGRQVTVSAITNGTVTETNTATHWAISYPGNSELLATGSLSSSQAVTDGNTFTLTSFTIGIPDPA